MLTIPVPTLHVKYTLAAINSANRSVCLKCRSITNDINEDKMKNALRADIAIDSSLFTIDS